MYEAKEKRRIQGELQQKYTYVSYSHIRININFDLLGIIKKTIPKTTLINIVKAV
jgi:hypothetical protein